MKIVAEAPSHRAEVMQINRLAFKGDTESRLIRKLERDASIVASYVALAGDEVVGHILFSPLYVVINGKQIDAVALAPMCVMPERQNQGIGSQLVRHGIEQMKLAGKAAIIVLGHTDYYPRFGFSHELAKNLACDFNQYEAFMGLELITGSLGGQAGSCLYARAFDSLK